MKKKIASLILISQLLVGSSAWAQQSFVVKRIEFQGLQRVTPATAESYLPIKRGQTLQPGKTADILRALYQTGFFDQVTLSKEDNTLIIHVVERPTIGQLKITGNSIIPTDKLTTVMKSLDVAEGRVYNAAVLDKIKQSLLNQYYQLGRYNARVDVNVTPMSRNRVLVKIDISEGLVAKVRRISIIGNHVFDESTLIKQMDLTTSGLTTFITQTDRYSEEKLESSVEKIRGYYMDHGYLRFEVKSAQAQVTPDRKSVYVTIVVSEGQKYTVDRVDLAGDLLMPRDELMKYVLIKPGETFSRQKVLDTEKSITKVYGEKGYMFASISVRPQVNENMHQVALVFDIKSGKRAYVRQVTFSDNTRTNDVVLRREVQQMEAAPASTSRLDESKQRLLLLPYIKEAEMSVKPVPGVDDQVDVNYKVKEDNSAQASFKVGYSQVYRVILGAGLNQKNFFGTGNTLGINFSRSKYEQFYGIDYTNPYYTEDGISRSFNLSLSRVDPGGAGVDAGYTSNEYNMGVLYGIPIGQERRAISRLLAGVSYQNVLVNLIPGKVSNQVNTYINRHSRHFQEADFKLGISRDSRDKAIFPTSGSIQSLFLDAYAPLDKGSVSFYTLNYAGKFYQPIYSQFILLGKANLGYGSGFHGARDFPFFKNYYAGGIDTVRGYQGYSLGPKDSNYHPFGANMLVDGSVSLIFPNFISDSLRTSAFLDAGNVYSSLNNISFGGQSTNSGPLRYSAGIEADWLTPFGPIELSLAQPLNLRKHDERETFQFALGANF
jgi:outer membrane protein insertion porin family